MVKQETLATDLSRRKTRLGEKQFPSTFWSNPVKPEQLFLGIVAQIYLPTSRGLQNSNIGRSDGWVHVGAHKFVARKFLHIVKNWQFCFLLFGSDSSTILWRLFSGRWSELSRLIAAGHHSCDRL